ncbi:sensor histidine kinase [Gryllotalpicola reticulitermitis]|uniref:histidine kinase n=1 Tax=Gryllotalpicola reticulitermitis TaxID=1184153 RepID=A0ABV8Q919_9MICO
MKRVSGSLTARLVVAAIVVALLGAGVTLGVAYQLVRTSTVEQSQSLLRSTARVVAKAPPKERATLVQNLDRAQTRGIRLLLLRANGTTVPTHSDIPQSAVDSVRSAGAAAGRFRSSGRTYLFEGVRVSQGDAVIATQDFSLVHAAIARLFDRFLLAAGIGAALAAALGALVADRIARPLKRTAGVARRLAAGERGTSAPPPTPLVDIAAIDVALAALDEALRTSESRQREFLLSISHELRTPLTGIRGYADALADGLVPADGVRDAGTTLGREAGRLDAFVGDLLELARLQADDFPLAIQQFDVAVVVEQALQAWGPTAAHAAVRLETGAPTGALPLTVMSDPMRVRQLLDGLLENALRAAPAGSRIRIGVASGALEADPAVRISVADDGPGLRPEDVKDAFERGVLANRYRNSRPVGTGLGLSIAARLTRRLGGRITVSTAGGHTEFAILLPQPPAGSRILGVGTTERAFREAGEP